MSDPLIIEHPEKIGIGTGYSAGGLDKMLGDLGLIGANWFYTWAPNLPASELASWMLGGSAGYGGPTGDLHLEIGSGSDAWVLQSFQLQGSQTLALSFDATTLAGSTGVVELRFFDASGKLIGSNLQTVSNASDDAYLLTATSPAGTSKAWALAYTASGEGIEVDNISVRINGQEAIKNGNIETITRVDDSAVAQSFTPMVWGAADMAAVRASALDDSDTLLTFNEPDSRSQANLTVAQALSYWPELMATGKRLGSPAVTTGHTLGDGSWLKSFMTQADALGYRVDFIAVHYYSASTDVAAFRNFLEKVHAAYGRPIWVTEWSLADWNNPDRFTAEQQATFFTKASQMMDDLPYVERHAWFGVYDGMDGWNLKSNLLSDDGALTAVGTAFSDLASTDEPSAPEPTPTPDPEPAPEPTPAPDPEPAPEPEPAPAEPSPEPEPAPVEEPPVSHEPPAPIMISSTTANETFTGTEAAESFFFSLPVKTGADAIKDFGKNDVLVLSGALKDSNNDGIIIFGRGVLNLGDGDTVYLPDLKKGLRLIGQDDHGFVYADASVRVSRSQEGRIGVADTLAGDHADTAVNKFFVDTALNRKLGDDEIVDFGRHDILITTTKLEEGPVGSQIHAEDGAFALEHDGYLLGSLSVSDSAGHAVSALEFDGEKVANNGVHYFVYSLVDSSAGLAQLTA